MAAPTTSLGNVTVRKLNSVIASLWNKIKNTFAPKDDGQQTHDTTKFYRADGSWAVPTGDQYNIEFIEGTITRSSSGPYTYSVTCSTTYTQVSQYLTDGKVPVCRFTLSATGQMWYFWYHMTLDNSKHSFGSMDAATVSNQNKSFISCVSVNTNDSWNFMEVSNFDDSYFGDLAFKDTASYSDLSRGVQSSLDKADTALQASSGASSITPGDTTHVPTADAVYNFFPTTTIYKENQTINRWKKVATSNLFTGYDKAQLTVVVCGDGYTYASNFGGILSVGIRTGFGGSLSDNSLDYYKFKDIGVSAELLRVGSTNQYELWVRAELQDTSVFIRALSSNNFTFNVVTDLASQLTDDEYATYKASNPSILTATSNIISRSSGAKGDTSQPVYVDGNGQVQLCNAPASSITSDDNTHVPTSQAVYNYALPRGAYARITASGWVRLAVINYSSAYLAKCGGEIISSQEIDGQDYYIGTFHVFFTLDKNANTITGELLQSYNNNSGSNDGWVIRLKYDTNTHKVYVYGFCGAPLCAMSVMALCPAASEVNLQATLLGGTYDNPPSELAGSVLLDTCRPVKANGSKSVVGSPSNPVYVKSDGSVKACNTSFVVNPGSINLTTTPYSGYAIGYVLDVINTGSSMIYVTTGNGSSGVPVDGCRRFCKTESNKWKYVALS